MKTTILEIIKTAQKAKIVNLLQIISKQLRAEIPGLLGVVDQAFLQKIDSALTCYQREKKLKTH